MRFKALVKEVMRKKIKTVRMNDPIKKAARIMKKNNIGSVLVMNKGVVEGIVTDRDIVFKFVALKKGNMAKDIMTKDPVTISQKKTIEDAALLMAKKKIEKLPVIDNGKIVGIITSNDILKIEPALFNILLEKMKIGQPAKFVREINFGECEICGNYSDDIEEKNGEYMCKECREDRL